MTRSNGHRFPRAQTVQLLRMLGAAALAIEETVNTPPLPEVVVGRTQRAIAAERSAEVAAAAAAIRDKIEFHMASPAMPPIRARRPRTVPVHPNQLALAL